MHETGRVRSLQVAQAKAQSLFDEIEQSRLIRSGISKSEASRQIYRLSRDKYHAGRHSI